MEPTSRAYPMRVFVKHRAKEQIKARAYDRSGDSSQGGTASHRPLYSPFDERLFEDIATTLLSPSRPEFRHQCKSRQEAAEIEARIAAELVEIYAQIKLNQRDPLVQMLNALL
ncbi:hypothetical protein H6G89_06505 [Oscillatoria sp. FACHB-1407]|uniref:hypothetical protein n=1 Tax=Oscillatoria sp. FACHB-1407 TaxID=2692847 RepID=UPI0016867FDE|nr:hypothetical protein [Oscillatoria sp. FACHB-1407]MBD2460690.1 hypothetical protein [Oscillatoria sp. FACHB-1407]